MLNMFIEDFTVLDHCFVDPVKGMLGGTFFVDAEVYGQTTEEEAVVIDFSQAKKVLKKVIDATADHRFVCPKHLAKVQEDGRIKVEFKQGYYIAPEKAFYFLDTSLYSLANLQSQLERDIMKEMPSNVSAIKLTLRYEDFTGYNFYRYTHGLKTSSSEGCRRMGHGHINKIIIEQNGERRKDLEKEFSNFIDGKHLCIKENIRSGETVQERVRINLLETTNNLHIEVCEGAFDLAFDKSSCLIMPYETTVENICKYIAEVFYKEVPNLVVKCFEGYKKGCVYYK